MAIKFITAPGTLQSASSPYYRGFVQHVSIVGPKETYRHLSEKLGYAPARIKSAFLGLAKYLKQNANNGNASTIDEVATIRTAPRGSFEGVAGPWVKGKNFLVLNAISLNPFKSTLQGEIPVNKTEGAKPLIKTVMDNVTGEYDVITGTNAFTVAGTDLGPDMTKEDEFVGLRTKDGTLVKATITASDLNTVTAALSTTIEAGEYTLVVATRSGLGEEYGVAEATRKIKVA